MKVRKLTPVLAVDAIEPCLDFWRRLGFQLTAEVPHEDKLGFVILEKDGVEIMYQTRASIAAAIGATFPAGTPSTALFIEVSSIDTVIEHQGDAEVVVPRRQTFYGMDEIGLREPGGTTVSFASPIAS
jgi:hypothetical protein